MACEEEMSDMDSEMQCETAATGSQDEAPLKKTMADLEDLVADVMIRQCKFDACLDRFLQRLVDIRGDSWGPLPDFALFQESEAEQLQRIATEMRTDIDRLLPGHLDRDVDILSNSELREALDGRWRFLKEHYLLGENRRRKEPELNAFQRSLLHVLSAQHGRQPADGVQNAQSAAPALKQLAFDEACRQLEESIAGERASASFVCGGTIPIGDTGPANYPSTPTRTVSSPVHIFWASGDDCTARQLVLPLNHNAAPDSSVDRLRQLVADCNPASFGRGQQDVIDPEYRKAGKLDPERFASSFHPADFGIIENAEQILFPSCNSETQNDLPFRKLSAELYKLNVYSGPSGLFRKHVDTPRSESQIGSLVVCLPSPFHGGDLVVRHHGREVAFKWSSQSASAIQWAAFYSDCEHEIMTISEGERITLTYNLYVTEPAGRSIPPHMIVDPKTFPLRGFLKDLVTEPGFMKDGGVLGVYCSHAYPHSSGHAQALLPRALKGTDLVLYSVFKSLGLEVDVLPVLMDEEREYREACALQRYLEEGRTPTLDYCQFPLKMPVNCCADVDQYWKMLYLSRRVKGMEEITKFAQRRNLPTKSSSAYRTKGANVGTQLWPYRTTDRGEDDEMETIINETWPAQHLPGVTWIAQPRHPEMAFSYVAYGNEASIGTVYSCAAILAVIPPFDQRQAIIGRSDDRGEED